MPSTSRACAKNSTCCSNAPAPRKPDGKPARDLNKDPHLIRGLQALAAANSTNSKLEGDDGATDTATVTVRLGNTHQISAKVARVSGTQRVVEHAGRDDELDYQMMLKGKELKDVINGTEETGRQPRAQGSVLESAGDL